MPPSLSKLPLAINSNIIVLAAINRYVVWWIINADCDKHRDCVTCDLPHLFLAFYALYALILYVISDIIVFMV